MRRDRRCSLRPKNDTRMMVLGTSTMTTRVSRMLSCAMRMSAPIRVMTARNRLTRPEVSRYWMLPTSLVMRAERSPAFCPV